MGIWKSVDILWGCENEMGRVLLKDSWMREKKWAIVVPFRYDELSEKEVWIA